MFSSIVSKKNSVLLALCLFFITTARGQAPDKTIYKKYTQKDSASIYRSGQLIFYTDSTFINFGILDNKKALDIYVWYKAGTWSLKGDGLECHAGEKNMKDEDLKKMVKFYYKKHKDRVMIENYYEFVHETYNNETLRVSTEQASDNEKNIAYYEIKL